VTAVPCERVERPRGEWRLPGSVLARTRRRMREGWSIGVVPSHELHIKTEKRRAKCYSIGYMPQSHKNRRPQRSARFVPPPLRRALANIAADVAVWRKLRGLTQAQLADRAGVSRDTLARLEGGEGGISLENLLRVLRALGVLDSLTRALDPYESDVGRLRADERLPQRVRPRSLTGRGDG
jgi:DNA-binding XRE family transcriptional regulator